MKEIPQVPELVLDLRLLDLSSSGSAEWTDDVVNDRIPQNRQTSLSSFSSSISLSLPSFQSITLINRSNYYTTTYWSQ